MIAAPSARRRAPPTEPRAGGDLPAAASAGGAAPLAPMLPAIREFTFTDADFTALAALVFAETGIVLKEHKQEMVYGRLARRLRQLGLTRFDQYLARLKGPDGAEERSHLINAITTNLTRFWREPHHFELLRDEVLPALLRARAAKGERRLRLWSAGCSSGQEPYCIAMVLADALEAAGGRGRWDARILASDIDTNMLAVARAALYPPAEVTTLPADLTRRHIQPSARQPGMMEVRSDTVSLVAFRHLNLLGPWPMQGRFDAIFCRNVVIYFDDAARQHLAERFGDALNAGGVMFMGHSETLPATRHRYHRIGQSAYRLGTLP